jgi:hypothetical protein
MQPSPFAFALSDVAGDHYLTRDGLFRPVEEADLADDLLLFTDEPVAQAFADRHSPDGRPRLRVHMVATWPT